MTEWRADANTRWRSGWTLRLALAAGLTAWALTAGPVPAQEPSGLEVLASVEEALVDSIARAEPSVVSIARFRLEAATSFPFGDSPFSGDADPADSVVPNEFGAGVIIDARGLVLTNYHVLGEDSTYQVTTVDGRRYEARVKAADPRSDLAVLELVVSDGGQKFETIPLGDASKLRKGQFVIALGNPYTIARDGQASASWGIVANLSRKAAPALPGDSPGEPPKSIHHFGTLIQTDAKLNLGTSGGPLLNLRGEMVGLITAEAAITGYEESAGYAIPVDDMFRWVVERLKEGREAEYGFLGVQPLNLPQDQPLRGTLLSDVRPGTPAHRAGLRPNDVVVAIDGQPIDGVDGLMLHVGRRPADSNVRLTIERGSNRQDIVAQLAKFPVRGQKIITQPAPSWRDVRVDHPTVLSEEQRRFDFPMPESCVLVTEVAEGSPAWEAGLKPEMFVTHVGATPVATPREFFAAVKDREGDVPLRIWSSSNDETVIVVP